MLSSLDIKKLQEVFATKEELVGLENRFNRKFATKEDLIELEARLESKFVTKDEFLKGFDALMFELKAIREDLAVTTYRNSEISKKLENHEDRIISVEEKLSF
ncbi:hypothetical protein KA089_02195 [Candidatus Woesebacteria bacterium]|nr:hypothetical protein [Candidatus Woesebacteria bacterium]